MNLNAYSDINSWQYYVDECGMKQESLDLMKRSVEFVMAHEGCGL